MEEIASNIASGNFQAQVHHCLLKLWGPDVQGKYENRSGIPVPLPVTLDRAELARISRSKVWISPKADGHRAFLVFGCKTDPRTRAVLRDAEASRRSMRDRGQERAATDVTEYADAPWDLFMTQCLIAN